MATDSIIIKALVEEKAQGDSVLFFSANSVIADHFIVSIVRSLMLLKNHTILYTTRPVVRCDCY